MPSDVYEIKDAGSVGDSQDSPESLPVKPRKAVQRAKGRTGRSAFVDPICKDHPDWEDENGEVTYADGVTINCAKFAHLPGRGRGVYQPGIIQMFKSSASELVKPIFLLSLLGAAFFILTHFLGGGLGGVLQPKHTVCKSTSTVSGSRRPTSTVSPSSISGKSACRNSGGTTFLHVSPNVTATPK